MADRRAAYESAFSGSEIDAAVQAVLSGTFAKKSDLSTVYKYKGSVADLADLPAEDNEVGDVWNVEATDMNYGWTGSGWDPLGQSFQAELGAKQDKLTGLPGQVVGFDEDGKPIPQSTDSLVGPQGEQGPPGPPGDSGTGGGSASGEIYSTEETRIGTWIDGKPLYRKVYQITTPNVVATQTLVKNTGLSGATIVNFYGIFYGPSNAILPTSFVGNPATGAYATGLTLDNNIYMAIGHENYKNRPGFFVIEYTKTTDQPVAIPTAVLSSQEALDK